MTLIKRTSQEIEIYEVAKRIRLRVFEHVLKNNGGYLSQACSSAEIFSTLYMNVMKLGKSTAPFIPPKFNGVPGPTNPDYFRGGAYNGPQTSEYDYFIFSPSHYALVLYATLIEVGRLAPEALDEFNRDGSTVEMIGHEHSPGVDTTTGSLGQAISQAGGFALARKLLGETGRVWVFMTDGEFQEGEVWEAVATMAHYKLDNIGIYVDINGQQCDGLVENVMGIEPLKEKLNAFGARAVKVDGHNVQELTKPARWKPDGRPLFVLAYTNPIYGIDLLEERAPKLHYVRFKSQEEWQEYRDYYNNLSGKAS